MSASEVTPAPELGVVARAIGTVTSPGETFRSVVQHPRPASMLFLVCLVIGLCTGLPQFTERGQQAVLDSQVQQMERFTGQAVTPEVYAQMQGRAKYGAYLTIVSIFIFLPIASVFFTALYWVAFNSVLGGTATFKQVLAVVAHSQVIGALGVIAAAPIQYVQGAQSMFGPFNLGALLPMLEPGSFLANFLGALTVFQIWGVIVTAIGLGVLYHRKIRNIALTLLVLYAGLMAGIAYATSLFRR